MGRGVAGIKDHYKTLTGSAPPTCPWRVFYEPLVAEVVGAVNAARENLGSLVFGEDPPAILCDGVRVYLAARNAATVYVQDQEKKKREAEAGARKNKNR